MSQKEPYPCRDANPIKRPCSLGNPFHNDHGVTYPLTPSDLKERFSRMTMPQCGWLRGFRLSITVLLLPRGKYFSVLGS